MGVHVGRGVSAGTLQIDIFLGDDATVANQVGDLLMSTSSTPYVLKQCTALPSTWSAIEGGAGSFTDLTITSTFALGGVITPTQLVANTDNWAPTGLSGASVIRVSTDASRNLTGLTGGAANRLIILQNVGSFPLVLVDDATSTAANRFQLSANVTVGAEQNAVLQYDATSSRWRMLAGPSASGGQGDWIAADSGSAPSVAPVAAGTDAIAIGDGAVGSATRVIAIGGLVNSGITPGAYSIAIGSDDDATDNTQAVGVGAIAIGSSAGSTGNGARAVVANAIAIGSANTTLDGPRAANNGAIALGSAESGGVGPSSTGSQSVAIGSATGTGAGASASTTGAIAVGSTSVSSNTNTIAIGVVATASAVDAIAFGEGASATVGTGNIAIGSDALVAGTVGAIGIGDGAIASGTSSIALGVAAEADGANAIAIGNATAAGSAANTIAIGQAADATAANAIAIGGDNTDTSSANASAAFAVALGANAQADRYGEFALPAQNTGTAARTSNARWTGTTTNATPTEIFLLGVASNRLTLPSDSSMGATLYCTARRTDADGESAYFTISAALDNNAGTTAGVGATPFVTTATSSDFTTATIAASADNTNDALAITVTGEAGKTIRWVVQGLVTEARG